MPLSINKKAKIYIYPIGNYTRDVLNDGLMHYGKIENPDSITTTSGKRIAQGVDEAFVREFVQKSESDKNLEYEIWISYKNEKDLYFRGEMYFKRKKNPIPRRKAKLRRGMKKLLQK